MALTFDPTSFECVTTEAQLDAWVKDCTAARSLSVDTETTGLDVDHDHAVGVSLALVKDDHIHSCYIPTDHHEDGIRHKDQLPRPLVMKKLKPILQSGKPLILHNALYDFAIFEREGIRLANVHDTLWMGYALLGASDPRGLGMDHLSKRFLNYRPIKFSEVVIPALGHKDFRDVDLARATDYAAEDSAVTFMLAKAFERILKGEGDLWRVYNQIDRPLIPVLHDMRRIGAKVDTNRLLELKKEWTVAKDKALKKVFQIAGTEFDIDSPKQLGLVLYDHLKIPCTHFTDGGARSTGKEALEGIDHQVADGILDVRKYEKLITTYCDALTGWRQKEKKDSLVWVGLNPNTKRVHANFNACVTKTRRFSSSDPNLQNIPTRTEEGAEIRGAFIAEKGNKLIVCDYSQIELRVLAHVTEEPSLVRAFHNGDDIHSATAAAVFGGRVEDYTKKISDDHVRKRMMSKNINFALLYGAGAGRIAYMCEISLPEAYQLIDDYYDKLPRVLDWKQDVWSFARKHGYIETIFGSRVILPNIKSKDSGKRSAAERLAVNASIQGPSADLMRLALSKTAEELPKLIVPTRPNLWSRPRLLKTVHDELVIESSALIAEKVKKTVVNVMKSCADEWVEWKVPIEVGADIGDSWKDAK